MSESSKVDRRRFLKYVGAGAVAVGGAAAYYLYGTSVGRNPEATVPTVTTTETPTSIRVNSRPFANFRYSPQYINPTDQQTVHFTNLSEDADGDPLKYEWLVDGQSVSTEKDYSVKLPVGKHFVQLRVSDGQAEDATARRIEAELDRSQMYPRKPLHIQYKGITYYASPVPPDWADLPNPDHYEMDEQLDTIRNELGCNAIIISGGEDYENKLIECGQVAIEKGFERIHIQPRYMGATPSETVEKISRFALEVRTLREVSESVVFCVGHEFWSETMILPGDTWIERFAYMAELPDLPKKAQATLSKMFTDIIAACKQNYGYAISYAAGPEADLIPWENAVFESVGVDVPIQDKYGCTEDWVLGFLSGLKRYRKPIDCMEAGCETFTGSAEVAGTSPLIPAQDRKYDEDEQANWIGRECSTLDRARIDGYFYTQYNDPPFWDTGCGLYNPTTRMRKKGFYMFKSYQRTP